MKQRLRKLFQPVLDLLTQGVTPSQITLSLALGAVMGTFPLLGTTTTICTILALALRLNLPAMQLSNYAVYPVQLALLVPFVRLGEKLTGAAAQPLSAAQVKAVVHSGYWNAAHTLWAAALHAVTGWCLFAIPAFFLAFALLRPVVDMAARSLAGRRAESAD